MPALTGRDDVGHHVLAQLAGHLMRGVTAVGQARQAFALVTFQPLVDRLAADAVDVGQGGDTFAIAIFVNQSDAEVHGVVLFPGHASACSSRDSTTNSNQLLPIRSVQSVTHRPGLDRAHPLPDGRAQ